MSIFETIINSFNGHIDAISGHTETLTPHIAEAAHLLVHTLLEGNRIICCSAGYSFPAAQHFCSEMDGLNLHRPALPCLLLGSNLQNTLTMLDAEQQNDQYARQLRALGNEGDTLLVLSSSGQEKSLINAIHTACERQLSIVSINSGSDELLTAATHGNCVNIPLRGLSKPQALAMQFVIINLLSDLTEQLLFGQLE